uniref:Adenylate cyclase activating polypeptide 1a n=1 Tax=Cyprinus carpio TaxID=7962 RepID=A0A8C1ZVF7_CYPCA
PLTVTRSPFEALLRLLKTHTRFIVPHRKGDASFFPSSCSISRHSQNGTHLFNNVIPLVALFCLLRQIEFGLFKTFAQKKKKKKIWHNLFVILSLRLERHADGMFNKAYRKALGQLSARKYLHTLMAKRVGGGSMIEDDNEPLSKRHSDGVFTDSYSHYRKQMAVKKYLAAVLGKRYRQRYRSKGRRLAYL